MNSAPPPAERRSALSRLVKDFGGKHWRLFLIITPAMFVVALASASYGLMVKWSVDRLSAGDQQVAIIAPILAISAALAKAIAMYIQTLSTNRFAYGIVVDLQNTMFSRLIDSDYARFSRETSGSMISRFTNDVNVVSEGVVRASNSLLRDSLIVIFCLAAMLLTDWVLTLLMFVLFPIISGPLARIGARARKQVKAAQEHAGALTAQLSESLSAPRMIKTYALEDYERARANQGFLERARLMLKLVGNRARTEPIMEVMGGLAAAAILAVAGWRMTHGQATAGDLTGFLVQVGVAAGAARSLGTLHTSLNETGAAAARMFAMIDEQPAILDRPGAMALSNPRGAVTFDDVHFAYEGKEAGQALQGITLRVESGKTAALVGPSGAGKSTLFNLLTRLYDVTDGGVSIGGQDVRDVTQTSLRSAVGLVAQDATLFNDSISANIAFGRPGASPQDIEAAAKAAAAHDFITRQPNGYDTLVGERGASLSGGERQRIALARAFLKDAPILLLDEPTSALDSESEQKIQAALQVLSSGRTTLVIAHRLATVRDADVIFVLDRGRVVEQGDHDSLIAKGGLYARLAALQFSEPAV